ncbi:MAG: hypothetical protein OXF93_09190 [Acidobacteria bacterium]|nr:hypothetical protein [Acidobacteriota bacterium]
MTEQAWAPSGAPLTSTDATVANVGLLLILTTAATLVAVVGRVGADTDLPTLAESLAAIAGNRGLYGAGGAGRFASGATLLAAAWYLQQARTASRGAPIVGVLFAASGLLTAYSGAAAVVLAAIAPDGPAAAPAGDAARQLAETAALRQVSGAAGFAVAGVALVVAGWRQWHAERQLRRAAAVTMLLGLTMQFIWLDAATLVHQVTGIVFVTWLAVVGAMLRRGRPWLLA